MFNSSMLSAAVRLAMDIIILSFAAFYFANYIKNLQMRPKIE